MLSLGLMNAKLPWFAEVHRFPDSVRLLKMKLLTDVVGKGKGSHFGQPAAGEACTVICTGSGATRVYR